MEKYLELFKKYACEASFHSSWSDTPFFYEGFMYVTDGNSALRIKSNLLDDLPAFQNAGEKLKEIFSLPKNISFSILSATIGSYLAGVEQEDVTKKTDCKACESTGHVEYEFEYNCRTYEELLDCPVCDGDGYHSIKTGEKAYPITVYFKVGNCFFSAKYISFLKEIADFEGVSIINLIHQTEELKPSLFKIGSIELILMPCSLSSADFTIINFD